MLVQSVFLAVISNLNLGHNAANNQEVQIESPVFFRSFEEITRGPFCSILFFDQYMQYFTDSSLETFDSMWIVFFTL